MYKSRTVSSVATIVRFAALCSQDVVNLGCILSASMSTWMFDFVVQLSLPLLVSLISFVPYLWKKARGRDKEQLQRAFDSSVASSLKFLNVWPPSASHLCSGMIRRRIVLCADRLLDRLTLQHDGVFLRRARKRQECAALLSGDRVRYNYTPGTSEEERSGAFAPAFAPPTFMKPPLLVAGSDRNWRAGHRGVHGRTARLRPPMCPNGHGTRRQAITCACRWGSRLVLALRCCT